MFEKICILKVLYLRKVRKTNHFDNGDELLDDVRLLDFARHHGHHQIAQQMGTEDLKSTKVPITSFLNK